jgi:hypothetical protein
MYFLVLVDFFLKASKFKSVVVVDRYKANLWEAR